ncbi:MAG TPA: hypothetical protein VKR41_06850 [Puia sp.]|nr:hypothetical protein [Puia sp.]
MIADVAGGGIAVHDGHQEVNDDDVVLFASKEEYCCSPLPATVTVAPAISKIRAAIC